MGTFAKYAYEAEDGLIHPLRMSSADAAAQTTAAATTGFTSNISAKRSLSGRQIGLKPRYLRLTKTQTAGTGAGQVTKILYDTIPVLKKADFTAFTIGSTITINGVVWTILNKVNEREA